MDGDEYAAVKDRVCGSKRRYIHADARTAAQIRSNGGSDKISSYRCPFCGSWHVGHVPSMESLQQIADAIRFHDDG